jgi:hypothetical protein
MNHKPYLTCSQLMPICMHLITVLILLMVLCCIMLFTSITLGFFITVFQKLLATRFWKCDWSPILLYERTIILKTDLFAGKLLTNVKAMYFRSMQEIEDNIKSKLHTSLSTLSSPGFKLFYISVSDAWKILEGKHVYKDNGSPLVTKASVFG